MHSHDADRATRFLEEQAEIVCLCDDKAYAVVPEATGSWLLVIHTCIDNSADFTIESIVYSHKVRLKRMQEGALQ